MSRPSGEITNRLIVNNIRFDVLRYKYTTGIQWQAFIEGYPVAASSMYKSDQRWQSRIKQYCTNDYVINNFPSEEGRIWLKAVGYVEPISDTTLYDAPVDTYTREKLDEIESDIYTIVNKLESMSSDPYDLTEFYNELSDLEKLVVSKFTQTQKDIDLALDWQPAVLTLVQDLSNELDELQQSFKLIRNELDESTTTDLEWQKFYADQHRQELRSNRQTFNMRMQDISQRFKEQLSFHEQRFGDPEPLPTPREIALEIKQLWEEDGFSPEVFGDLIRLSIEVATQLSPMAEAIIESKDNLQATLQSEWGQQVTSIASEYGIDRSIAFLIGGVLGGKALNMKGRGNLTMGESIARDVFGVDPFGPNGQLVMGNLNWGAQWMGRTIMYETYQSYAIPDQYPIRSTPSQPIYWKHEFWGTKKSFNIRYYPLGKHNYNYKSATIGLRNLLEQKGLKLATIGSYSRYH